MTHAYNVNMCVKVHVHVPSHTVRWKILFQFNNYCLNLESERTAKVKKINYIFQFNYWARSKSERIGTHFRIFPRGAFGAAIVDFFGAAPSAPRGLDFSARRLRRREKSTICRRRTFDAANSWFPHQ